MNKLCLKLKKNKSMTIVFLALFRDHDTVLTQVHFMI